MSLRAYARRVGVSPEAVSKAVSVGRLKRSVVLVSRIPKIGDPELADLEWRANTRARADFPRTPRTRSARASTQVVYFIQCDGGPIKIGVALNVTDRLQTLQCGSPVKLRVIGCLAGGYELEAKLHRRLAAYRLHGEWFVDSPEVRAALAWDSAA